MIKENNDSTDILTKFAFASIIFICPALVYNMAIESFYLDEKFKIIGVEDSYLNLRMDAQDRQWR